MNDIEDSTHKCTSAMIPESQDLVTEMHISKLQQLCLCCKIIFAEICLQL